jgi:hypothetical protein
MPLRPLQRKSCYRILSPLKTHRLQLGLNPQISGPIASTLTTAKGNDKSCCWTSCSVGWHLTDGFQFILCWIYWQSFEPFVKLCPHTLYINRFSVKITLFHLCLLIIVNRSANLCNFPEKIQSGLPAKLGKTLKSHIIIITKYLHWTIP